MINQDYPFTFDLLTHKDLRGSFTVCYNSDILKTHSINFNTIQDNLCVSSINVFRGFHYQIEPQAKIIYVLNGSIKDYALDLRPGKDYGKIWEFTLTSNNIQGLYIPKGFAHGYLVLENNTIVYYKVDVERNSAQEYIINPLSIIKLDENIILSEKDMQSKFFDGQQINIVK